MSDSRILSSSAVMAAGTMVSRASGYLRTLLLVAALGASTHADIFNLANTVPNMVYILVAGGIFNAVLVPQLVRSMKNDEDGGEAYANRVITLAALFLGLVTVVLVVAAPQVMSIFLDARWDRPDMAAQRESINAFARYCLPQVFFYGMFVLVGQVLNARGRFGPMMWAPIANNVISVGVLLVYLLVFGKATGDERFGAFSPAQEAVLGIGSTLGIAVQFLVLLPYLRSAGFRYRPRTDFRNAGLGHTLRLGVWTVLFVLANQVAYTVVARLASSGTVDSAEGTGYTVYSSAFMIMMVPHAIITVSLATALLPLLSKQAADGDLRSLGTSLASGLRNSLVVVIPFVMLIPVVSRDVASVLFEWGAGADSSSLFAPSLVVFAPGLLFFTFHYFMLRGFYALEQTRTAFLVQLVIAAVNIVMALLLVGRANPASTAPALAMAYGCAYLVGAAISYATLARQLGTLDSGVLVRFLVRMLLAGAVGTAVAWALNLGLTEVDLDGKAWSLVRGGTVALVGLTITLALARAMRVREVTAVLNTVTARLRRS
ncbi:MAG: murein biosynthesis integral membrane protein MurJ [Nocardioides sp.]|uniref:murein biosynthesis integral membrane protein MurJ n=1 Tax=Nocardioides sp. TaxID=35761 RepID=UPI003F0C0079